MRHPWGFVLAGAVVAMDRSLNEFTRHAATASSAAHASDDDRTVAECALLVDEIERLRERIARLGP